jgi:nitrate reductase beta subunit
VGRIRSVGVILYDADRIEATAKEPDERLVEAMREIVLDPNDPKVADAARKNGVDENWLAAAKESPAYNLFKKWRIAMPHHPEYRTLPMNFYVPPLSPILHMSKGDEGGTYDP